MPAGLALPPPIYGQWHGAQSSIPPAPVAAAGARDTSWLRDLNLSPHLRVAAGLAAQIVREKQEELMAWAWRQAGTITEANQLLRQGQATREAARGRFGRIASLPDETLILFAGPALARVAVPPDTMEPSKLTALGRCGQPHARERLHRRIPAHRAESRAVGAPHRKGGGCGGRPGLAPAHPDELGPAPSEASPEPDRNDHGGRRGAAGAGARQSEVLPGNRPFLAAMAKKLAGAGALSQTQKDWFAASQAHGGAMAPCAPAEPPPPRPALDVAAVAAAIRENLNPNKTIAAAIAARVSAPKWNPLDSLTPVMAAPVFDTPMYRALASHSQEYLLAGLEPMPKDAITSVQTNPAFVSAFMAGLNHEMSRLLLWREYPTDQRGTYFRQFWDPFTRVPPPATAAEIEAARDIAPMHLWSRTEAIDAAANGPSPYTNAETFSSFAAS